MTNAELRDCIKVLYFGEGLGEVTFDETGEWLNVLIDAPQWKDLARKLKLCADLDFDFLFSITGVDWKTHLSVVYHLRSIKHGHIVVVKAKCDRAKPEIETVCGIWRTAELNEREVFDLLGVKFLNHPDLRRLFLTDEWEGYPLRKDYVDEVNMVKL